MALIVASAVTGVFLLFPGVVLQEVHKRMSSASVFLVFMGMLSIGTWIMTNSLSSDLAVEVRALFSLLIVGVIMGILLGAAVLSKKGKSGLPLIGAAFFSGGILFLGLFVMNCQDGGCSL